MSSVTAAGWLILGGCGFIGRNLLHHLLKIHTETTPITVTVADKTPPQLAFLSSKHAEAFDDPRVAFLHCDLTRDSGVSKVLNASSDYNYIVNCCGETRFGLQPQEYRSKCIEVAVKCATAAIQHLPHFKQWIEISTAQVYDSDVNCACNESAAIAPWTVPATARYEAEQQLLQLHRQQPQRLPLVILRPSLVYGCGDFRSFTPRLCVAAVYKCRLNEKLKFLWDDKLKMNCVAVEDVCAAVVAVTHSTTLSTGEVVNLSESGSCLDQGQLNSYLANVFNIQVGCVGNLLSAIAKTFNLSSLAAEANEKHLPEWIEVCKQHSIENTPLSPYIDKELLLRHQLWIDGRKALRVLPHFQYKYCIDAQVIKSLTQQLIEEKLFPAVI